MQAAMSEKEAARDVFPHDRVVFFSDAVFAIAITLLAIELRLPTQEMVEHVGAEAASREVVSLFIAYIVSFLLIFPLTMLARHLCFRHPKPEPAA
jgi:uncharacterized membrane protein